MTHSAMDLLLTRRSVKAAEMGLVAPSAAEQKQILTAASRVPDHGKTVPFYFITFQGDELADIGARVLDVFKRKNPDAGEQALAKEETRFARAPWVVAVVYRKRHAKHPLWEQMMSAGAACQNMLLAAHALGYVGQWLSEWYAYDEEVRGILGLDDRDTIAGFIHIGSAPNEAPEDRERPDLDVIVNAWSDVKEQGQAVPEKGDAQYDRTKFPLPRAGVSI